MFNLFRKDGPRIQFLFFFTPRCIPFFITNLLKFNWLVFFSSIKFLLYFVILFWNEKIVKWKKKSFIYLIWSYSHERWSAEIVFSADALEVSPEIKTMIVKWIIFNVQNKVNESRYKQLWRIKISRPSNEFNVVRNKTRSGTKCIKLDNLETM